jgi:hypothetical protein
VVQRPIDLLHEKKSNISTLTGQQGWRKEKGEPLGLLLARPDAMQGKKASPRSNAKVNFHMLSDEPLRWNPFLRKGTVWLLRELESYRFPKKQAGPLLRRAGKGRVKGKRECYL